MSRTIENEFMWASMEALCRCLVYVHVDGLGYVRPEGGWSMWTR